MIVENIWRELVLARLMDQEATQALRPHAGKSFKVVSGPFAVALRIDDQGYVHPVHPAVTSDATIKVPLRKIAGDSNATTHAEGDSDLLSALGRLVEDCDLSVDAIAERCLGANAGSAVAVGCRKAREWGVDARSRLSSTFADWLTQDGCIFPDPAANKALKREIESFARRVEEVGKRVDAMAGDRA